MERLIEVGNVLTGNILNLDLCVRLGKESFAEDVRRDEEAREQKEAERRAEIVKMWQPHYAMLDGLGLGMLRQYAPQPALEPEYHNSTYDGYDLFLRPLVLRIPGYAPIGLVLHNNRWGNNLGGFHPATYEIVESDEAAWVVEENWPRFFATDFAALPSFEGFCRALAVAQEYEAKRPELEAAAHARTALIANMVSGPEPEPVPQRKPAIERIADVLEQMAAERGMR